MQSVWMAGWKLLAESEGLVDWIEFAQEKPLQLFLMLCAGMVGLIVFAGLLGGEKGPTREQQLAKWAKGLGCQFSTKEHADFDDRFAFFKPFRKGQRRFAYNVTHGTVQGRRVWMFDYHFQTPKDNEQVNHHHCSAVAVEADFSLQPLEVRSQTALDSLLTALGVQDIDFESAEFNRRFHVSAQNRRWAFDVLHPRSMQRLMKHPGAGSLVLGDRYLLWWPDGQLLEPVAFEQAADLLVDVASLLPDHLKNQRLPMNA